MTNIAIMVITVLLPMLPRAVLESTQPLMTSTSIPIIEVSAMGILFILKLMTINRNTSRQIVICMVYSFLRLRNVVFPAGAAPGRLHLPFLSAAPQRQPMRPVVQRHLRL